MISLAGRNNILGQSPFISPNVMNLVAPEPVAPVAAAPAGGGERAVLVGGAMLAAALMATQTLFTYGLAKEAESKTTKTTGYILAGVGALGTLAYLIGGPVIAAMSGGKK